MPEIVPSSVSQAKEAWAEQEVRLRAVGALSNKGRKSAAARVASGEWMPQAVVVMYILVLSYVLLSPAPLWFLGTGGETVQQAVDRTVAGFLQHLIAYAVLIWLLIGASWMRTDFGAVVWTVVAVSHGMVTEWLQLVIVERQCDWVDIVANVSGIALGWGSAIAVAIVGVWHTQRFGVPE